MPRPRNNGFAADVTFGGKRYRTSGWKTWEAAATWEHQAMANLLAGKDVPTGPGAGEGSAWTLSEMFKFVYEEHWEKTSADPSFFLKNISILERDLGPNYPVLDLLGPSGYDTVVEKCRERGNNGNTINKKASLLAKALKFSIDKGKIRNVLKPQWGTQPISPPRDRIMTREEEAECLAWARCVPEFADWMVLGLDTGVRSYSEGLHIYPHHDTRGRDLVIRGRIVSAPNVHFLDAERRTKTGKGKSRVVGMTSRVQALVARHKDKLGRDDRLFHPTLTAGRIDDLWDRMTRSVGIVDKTLVPYSLRHTFGTRMILAGETVANLAVLMGHSNLKQTWKYVHLAGLIQGGAVDKLEEFLKKS